MPTFFSRYAAFSPSTHTLVNLKKKTTSNRAILGRPHFSLGHCRTSGGANLDPRPRSCALGFVSSAPLSWPLVAHWTCEHLHVPVSVFFFHSDTQALSTQAELQHLWNPQCNPRTLGALLTWCLRGRGAGSSPLTRRNEQVVPGV